MTFIYIYHKSQTLLGFQPFCSRVWAVASGLLLAVRCPKWAVAKRRGGWDSKIVRQSCDNVSHRDAASRKNLKFCRLPTPTVLTTAYTLATSARLSVVYIGRPTHCCASSSAMGLAWMTMLWQRHKLIKKTVKLGPPQKNETIVFQASIFRGVCC